MSETAVDTPASPFVSTQWLAANLGAPDLVVVDASWHMPNSGRSGATCGNIEFKLAQSTPNTMKTKKKMMEVAFGWPMVLVKVFIPGSPAWRV